MLLEVPAATDFLADVLRFWPDNNTGKVLGWLLENHDLNLIEKLWTELETGKEIQFGQLECAKNKKIKKIESIVMIKYYEKQFSSF